MLLKCACSCSVAFCILFPEFNFIMLSSGHQYTCRNKLLVILCWLLVWLDPCDIIDCCYPVTSHHADPVWRTYLVSAMVYYMLILPKKWFWFLLFVCVWLLLAVWLYQMYWLHRNCLCLSMVNRQLKNQNKMFLQRKLLSGKIILFSDILTGSSFQSVWWFVMTSLLIFLVMFIFCFNFKKALFVHVITCYWQLYKYLSTQNFCEN